MRTHHRPAGLPGRVARLLVLLLPTGLLFLILAQGAAGVDPSASASAAPLASVAAPGSTAPFAADTSAPSSSDNASVAPASPIASPTPTPPPLDVPTATPSPPPPPPLPFPPPPARIVHPGDNTTNKCYDCHIAIDANNQSIAQQWKASAHGNAGISCADCHGGDPTSDLMTVAMAKSAGFIGKPDRNMTVGLCGSCHSDPNLMRQYGLATDMYNQYYASVHGQQLLKNDTRVAICIDCHGTHDIKKASDPTAPVYPLNIPKLCSSCHSDPTKMASYGIPTDQFAVYQQSIHGQQLLVKQDLRAPTCASCHGSHDAKPPSTGEIAQVCGKCHTATQALFEQSRHSQLPTVGPVCITCHGNHDVVLPSDNRFFHPTPPKYDCATCHDPQTRVLRIDPARFNLDADRRCDSCHHPASTFYAQAQGIQNAIQSAASAYDTAESKITEAAQVGMLVSDAQVKLTEANTSLVQARAAVHTTKLDVVAGHTNDAIASSAAAQKEAESALSESVFRRQAMIVVVVVILINVLALYLLRRRVTNSEA